MTKHVILISLCFILFFPIKTLSQSIIKGQVTDYNNRPINSANIVLRDTKKNTVKYVQIADSTGAFKFEATKFIDAELRIISMGFREEHVQIKDIPFQNILVRLKELPNNLKEVIVSARLPLIERKIDRLVFKIENSISIIGSDAYEVLSKAPSVRTGEDGISIIGKNEVRIMVDSRLTQLSGSNLINYLRSINAEEIKEIEIITNPSAKYEASGNSGLINIILKKNKIIGYNGSINTGLLVGKYATTGLTGLFNYNVNKLHINSNLTGSLGKNYSYTNGLFKRPEYKSEDFYTNISKRRSLRGSASIDYDLSKFTALGIKFEQVNNGVDNYNDRNVTYIGSRGIDSLIHTPGGSAINYNNSSVYFYLQHLLDTSGKKIDFDASFIRYGNSSNNQFASSTSTPASNIERETEAVNSLTDQTIDVFSTKLDFTFPSKFLDLEYGGKASFIHNNSLLDYSSTALLKSEQQNTFDFNEHLFAVYLSAEKKIKSWNFKAGIRAEHTYTKVIANTVPSLFTRSYTNLFPTVYINYQIDDSKTIGVSYGKRINRPFYDFLNPARIYFSQFNYEEGNPNLIPSFTHNFEINFNTDELQTSLYATILKNGFSLLTIIDPQSAVTIQTPINFLDSYQYGISESYTFNKFKWLESNNQINVYLEWDYFNSVYAAENRKFMSAYISTDNTAILNKSKTLRVNLRLFYQFPETYDFDNRKGYYSLNASFAASLLKRKLTIGINGTDILKTANIVSSGILNNVSRKFEYYTDNRTFRLSFIYRFGTNKNNKLFRDSSIEESERIKN